METCTPSAADDLVHAKEREGDRVRKTDRLRVGRGHKVLGR